MAIEGPCTVACHFLQLGVMLSLIAQYLGEMEQMSNQGIVTEYCDTEVFLPACDENEVIIMLSAKYGRMRMGRCVEIDLGYIGCYQDVLRLADRRCSGRRTCDIRIPDAEFEKTKPCLKELKTYLEASYMCIPVANGGSRNCNDVDHVNLTSSSGYLASIVTYETKCGSLDAPWVIQVLPGQRINITLFDFSLETTYRTTHLQGGEETHVCQEYGVVQEISVDRTSVICGGVQRIHHTYQSATSTIEVSLTTKPGQEKKYFILKYEAIGCPDLDPPNNAWYERRDRGAVIGCNQSDQKWYLTCSGTTWVGNIGNCSIPGAQEIEDKNGDMPLPYGAAVAIIIGAAIGVGVVIVIAGLLRYRKYKRAEDPEERMRGPMPQEVEMMIKPRGSGEGRESPAPCSTCQFDFLETQNTLPHSLPRTHAPTLPGGSFARHQLRTVVQINGNEYAHIWQTPLPQPRSLPQPQPGCSGSASSSSCEPSPSAQQVVYKRDNPVASVKPTAKVPPQEDRAVASSTDPNTDTSRATAKKKKVPTATLR